MGAFRFMTKADLTLLLGLKAKNTRELHAGLRVVPAMSVYYHTHRFLQQHHYLSPEPPNDFAYWVTDVLNNDRLGEQLASVDIMQCVSIEEIRERFLLIVGESLGAEDRQVEAPGGEEFHFMSTQTFAFPTPYAAETLQEFHDILGRVSINSIYYHMFDARLRPELGRSDFATWVQDLGFSPLAEAIQALDPYSHTLEGLRKTIVKLVEEYGGA